MAQLLVSTAGAAVGYYYGGAEGAKYGWAIGSAVGGALFPPKGPDGPRLGDLLVQTSTWGQAIARAWGTSRIAGNVIWSTPLIEQENEQGGKGGSSYSTFSYSCSFAVALCRPSRSTGIKGVARIWADGKLIYDIRPQNLGLQIGYSALSMVVYTGAEDQEVDPTIQAYQGDTPAYRGLAYVVFSGLQLEKFGNRLPNLTFEVVDDGLVELPAASTFGEAYQVGGVTFESDTGRDGTLWVSTLEGHGVVDATSPTGVAINFLAPPKPQVQRYNPVTQELLGFFNCPLEITYDAFGTPFEAHPIGGHGVCYGDRYYVGRGTAGSTRIVPLQACGADLFCAEVNNYIHGYSFGPEGVGLAFIDRASSGQFQNAVYWPSVPAWIDFADALPKVYFVGGNGAKFGFGVGFDLAGNQIRGTAACVCNDNKPPSVFDGINILPPSWGYSIVKTSTGALIQGYVGAGGSYLSNGSGLDLYLPGSNVIMPPGVFDATREALWMFAGSSRNELYNYGTAEGFGFGSVPGLGSQSNQVRGVTIDTATGNLRILIGGGFGATPRLLLFNPDTQTIIEELLLPDVDLPSLSVGRMFDVPGVRRVIYTNGFDIHSIPYGETLEPQPILLSQIVTDLSVDAGLTADEIDVTELTDLVLGYTVTRQGSTRSAIEQLMVAFQFDAVESEGRMKFVKRGKPPMLTIPQDDLAVRPSDGGGSPDPLPLVRADEADMPRVVVMRYLNADNDYQIGTQSAVRQTGRATAESAADLTVVLRDAAAKALADGALYSAWVARTTARWSTSMKYGQLEPTDVVTVDGHIIRILKRGLDGNVLTFEGAFDTGQMLTAGAVAGGVYPDVVSGQVVQTNVPTALMLMDTALVADEHNGPGFYLAAAGYGTPWTGAAIVKSSDGGSSFVTVDSVNTAATYGSVNEEIGDFSRNLFDEFNIFTVTLASGTLSSATELAVLNGANVALVGQELMQFKRAVLNDDGTYTVSGLLRGRKGTPTAGHVAGDRFVLIDGAVHRLTGSLAEVGLSRLYRGVSFGSSYESAADVYFTNNATGLKPLAPVLLGGGRDASENLTINWVRRTRLDGQWRDLVDAGLGESTEIYDVEIYETSSYVDIVRTITVGAQTATYSAADQVTDFGIEQSEVFVRIYQLGASVGRGTVLEGSV